MVSLSNKRVDVVQLVAAVQGGGCDNAAGPQLRTDSVFMGFLGCMVKMVAA